MNIHAHGRQAGSDQGIRLKLPGKKTTFLCLLLLLCSSNLLAQLAESAVPPETLQAPPVEPVVLPGSDQLALELSTPQLRRQALLDLAVAAHILKRVEESSVLAAEVNLNHAELAKAFLDDRAWLQVLVDRYGWEEPRSSVLDPAAWLVLGELQQHDIRDVSLVYPGSNAREALFSLVFQRAAERFAVGNLPALLLELEADAFEIWDAFSAMTRSGDTVDPAWKDVELTWFADRQAPVIVADEENAEDRFKEPVNIAEAMSRMVMSTVGTGPPDSRELKMLRYALLKPSADQSPQDNGEGPDDARDSLYVISLVDGLHDGRYFNFAQGLLSLSSRLLEQSVDSAEAIPLVNFLVAELPAISAHFAEEFAGVDPSLNTALAASFEVLANITRISEMPLLSDVKTEKEIPTETPEAIAENTATTDEAAPTPDIQVAEIPGAETANSNIDADIEVADQALERTVKPVDLRMQAFKTSRAILADAAAQLALMIPDMGYYFDAPVRARIAEEINICISISVSRDENGGRAMVRRQFDGCMETLLGLAETETRLAELSGNMNGPFTVDTLRRELSVTPWQRINYGIGYLHDRYSIECQPPARPLPNPLEWAVLATTMTWFAEQSPEFAMTPENEARLTKMRDIGEQMILELASQTECVAGSGSTITDPVSRSMTEYELALRELNQGIKKAELDFRVAKLSPGADVMLESDASQATAYRPEGLLIEPCDPRLICEMSGSLSTTRALIGIFPDEYLLAEQTGLGKIEICYRDMEWVERRAELVRPDDENVSNYYGRLAFDLVGRYTQNDESNDVFAFRFTSPEEHHYLFAQTSEEVLNDSCPVEWVGSRIVTPLRENRGGIVPNRLTYLAASRTLPSRLLQNNWDRGSEWRDWFVTGIGVSRLEVAELPDMTTPLNQHLQSLYQAEQLGIYQRVLLPSSRNVLGDDVSLFDEMMEVSIAKALIRMQMLLFYPESLFNSDSIRTAIAGDAGLLESRTMRRFREQNLPLTSVNTIALERLTKLRSTWSAQPEAVRRKGSIPSSLMHAMTRIHIVYRQYFASRPEPLQEIEATAPIQEQIRETQN